MKKTIQIISTNGTNEYQIYFPSVREVEENYYSKQTNSAFFEVYFFESESCECETIYSVEVFWQDGNRIVNKIDRRKKYQEILRLFGIDINE